MQHFEELMRTFQCMTDHAIAATIAAIEAEAEHHSPPPRNRVSVPATRAVPAPSKRKSFLRTVRSDKQATRCRSPGREHNFQCSQWRLERWYDVLSTSNWLVRRRLWPNNRKIELTFLRLFNVMTKVNTTLGIANTVVIRVVQTFLFQENNLHTRYSEIASSPNMLHM